MVDSRYRILKKQQYGNFDNCNEVSFKVQNINYPVQVFEQQQFRSAVPTGTAVTAVTNEPPIFTVAFLKCIIYKSG